MKSEQVGLSIRFIRSYDPESDRWPTAVDAEVYLRMKLAAFLRGAPDYDPEKHDALIRATVWSAI